MFPVYYKIGIQRQNMMLFMGFGHSNDTGVG
jgi:hypothetical protein